MPGGGVVINPASTLGQGGGAAFSGRKSSGEKRQRPLTRGAAGFKALGEDAFEKVGGAAGTVVPLF